MERGVWTGTDGYVTGTTNGGTAQTGKSLQWNVNDGKKVDPLKGSAQRPGHASRKTDRHLGESGSTAGM